MARPDLDLETLWLEVGGVRTNCLTANPEGRSPVLLLHGAGVDSARLSWGRTIGYLGRRHRVFAPDWPGQGESEKPDIDYTMDFYAGFVGDLMDALGLERASLVGLSLGGGAALGFALRSPERIEKLVLVDSYGLGGKVPLGRLGYLLVRAPLLNDLVRGLSRRSRLMVRLTLYNIVHDRSMVTEEMVEEGHQLLNEPAAGRAFRSFQKSEVGWHGLRTDFSDRLGELRSPTLIIHGEKDKVVPVAWARRAHERIPNSELVVLPGCGHWSPRERPEQVDRAVGRFLA